jgi:glyoxylase-like metal-dependent hydrolase (beta-lactamase superfamily II)
LRLESSRLQIAPWINDNTQLVPADEWLESDKALELGGIRFDIKAVGPSHTPEDLLIHLPSENLVFVGDLVFRGRIPFVGQADSRSWIGALDQLLALNAKVLLPGHGPASQNIHQDLQLTRDYLVFLRTSMAQAAERMEPFEAAYLATDWSRFEQVPMFGIVNRMNAYNTYLLLEQESAK